MPVLLEITVAGIVISGADPGFDVPVCVEINGRRVWSTRSDRGREDGHSVLLAWPDSLRPWLHGVGHFHVLLGPSRAPVAEFDGAVRFTDEDSRIDLVDPLTGIPLVVNKWGRLAKSFETANSEFFDRLLTSAEELAEVVRSGFGLDLFVTGGSLLGPVRDGHLIPNDDDVDFAYLSEHTNVSDILLESMSLERFLRARGFEIIRHSAAHFQVMYPGGSDVDEWYIDIFTYFITGGYFYGPFHICTSAEDVRIRPLGQITIEGHSFAAPADVDSMLTANYGPDWREPDPAFRFDTPDGVKRRFYWWLNHFDTRREEWEEWWRHAPTPGVGVESPFAAWVRERRTPDAAVYDIGAGEGRTLLALSSDSAGSLFMSDFARPALLRARRLLASTGCEVEIFAANQYSVRETSDALAHVCGRWSGTVDLIVENVFESLEFLGWDCTMQEIRAFLRRGGRAFVRVVVQSDTVCMEPHTGRAWDGAGFIGRLNVFGLHVTERVTCEGERGTEEWYAVSLRD